MIIGLILLGLAICGFLNRPSGWRISLTEDIVFPELSGPYVVGKAVYPVTDPRAVRRGAFALGAGGDPRRTRALQIIVDYTGAFFDRHLSGRETVLKVAPHPDYPEVTRCCKFQRYGQRSSYKGEKMKEKTSIKIVAFIAVVLILFVGLKKNINTRNLRTYDSEHFTIYYESLEPQTLTDLTGKLEAHYPDLLNFFGLDEQQKSRIIVYKSVERFQRAYLGIFLSYVFGDWAAGAAHQDTLLLTSPENPGEQHTYTEMLDIALHEHVHTLIYQINENADIWLDEGVATYLAQQRSELTADAVIPTFEQMQSQSQGDFMDNDGYTWSYLYIDYLVTTYGTNAVVKLIETNAYETCLGKSRAAIYTEWVTYLESN